MVDCMIPTIFTGNTMEKHLGTAVLLVVFLGQCSCSCPNGTYGYQCGYICNCDQNKCDSTSDCSPPACYPGWTGPTCQKHNVARKHATSSSGDFFPSSRATDGSTAAHVYTACIETNPSNPSWWRVDLNDTVLIREVTIYFRTDYRPRRNGIKVYVTNSTDVPSGDNCYTVIGRSDGSWTPDVTRAPCSGMGRYILLYTTVHNDGDTNTSLPVLDFCEVEVDVCGPGTFGSDCDNYCHCDGDVCNYVSGVCPSGICMSGWGSDSCDTGCVQGVQYGAGCVGNCSARMCEGGSGTCPRETGRCEDGCQSGWEGVDCIHVVSSLSPVTSVSPVVAGIIGSLTMLVVLAMVVGVVCLWRKGDFRMDKKTPGIPETSPAPPVELPTYDVLPDHVYTKLDMIHTDYETLQPTVDYQNTDVRI